MPVANAASEDRYDWRRSFARDPHRAGRQGRRLAEEFHAEPVLKEITVGQEDSAFPTAQRLNHPPDA